LFGPRKGGIAEGWGENDHGVEPEEDKEKERKESNQRFGI
jgi:hypothetical protein